MRLFADVKDGLLNIRIDDDGLGLHHARRPVRLGNGLALANIRARLHTRYGAQASLELAALEEGTRSSLTLPYSGSQAFKQDSAAIGKAR
ncbi:sensor histidine kinase [Pseudoduganella sp. S-14]|uniref:sensor histidine kinase n=1 Tax=Pseudoduganella sp. S-14 TaxID=3404065 RepID=UPI003CF56283